MTHEKFLETIHLYRRILTEMGVESVDVPHDRPPTTREERLGHCMGMLDRMEAFVQSRRMGKAYRWLGFMQGILWSEGIYLLNDLKDHNR